jgi:photosystem II stability/assembly factor-like uncharacterized protein
MKLVKLSLSLSLSFLTGAGGTIASAQDADNATLRAKARAEWYNEGYGTPRERVGARRLRSQGLWSPEFRRFMMAAAERERQKWGALIPGNGDAAPSQDPTDPAQARGGASWLNIGPTKANFIFNGVTLNVTDSGRVRSFAPHPSDANTLYVAFSGGGVWKTVNGGTNWAPLTEGLGSLSVGWLAMDRANPDTLYLGLGDPFDGTGIGLVKSTNGGTTWSAPVFLGNSTIINHVLVSPAASNVVLASTNAGLFRSTDSGASFTLVPIATGEAVQPYVWSIASTGGTGLVLSLEANFANAATGQVWHSADNGATWTRSANIPSGVERITVASAPSAPSIVYAMATNAGGNLVDIFRSTTGGVHFRALRAPRQTFTNPTPTVTTPVSGQFFNTQGWYDQMLVVDPGNPNHLFFGGALNTAQVTGADNPTTAVWRLVSEWLGRFNLPYVHADAHAAAYDVAGNLYFGTDGGIFKSTNNGASFTDTLNIGITTHLLYHLGSSTINRDVVIGGMQDNGTRLREGNGTIYNQVIGGDGFGCNINASNPQLMLGTVQFLSMRKSTNGGSTFAQACTGGLPCGSGPFISRVVPWTGSATGDVVITHSNTAVWKTSDYASNWAQSGVAVVSSGALRNVNIAHSNQNILGAVASAGRVFVSSNNGASWTDVSAGVPNNGLSLSDIHFDRVDPNIVYMASVAPDAGVAHLWKSTNFGANWARIDGSPTPNGFPTGVPVNAVRTDPVSPNIVYAATHLGVYRSTDGGTNWVRYGSGMPLVEVTDFYIAPDNSLVRASTFGRGYWELAP